MNFNEVKEVIRNTKKGTFTPIHKVKDLGKGVIKHTYMLMRMGIDYSNMKVNQGREIGELPWGSWNLFPWIIEHKGKFYLRIYNAYVDNAKAHSYFEYEGHEISKEQAIEIVGEKKVVGSAPSDVYVVAFENIVSIG